MSVFSASARVRVSPSRTTDFLSKRVLLVLREMIQVDIHQLRKLHKFVVQLRLTVLAHRYRSGRQGYKATRSPTLGRGEPRVRLQFNAHTPACEPPFQCSATSGHI